MREIDRDGILDCLLYVYCWQLLLAILFGDCDSIWHNKKAKSQNLGRLPDFQERLSSS